MFHSCVVIWSPLFILNYYFTQFQNFVPFFIVFEALHQHLLLTVYDYIEGLVIEYALFHHLEHPESNCDDNDFTTI